MLTLARRLFWLAVLSGAGYAVYTAWQRRNEPVADGRAEWPPLPDVPASQPSGAPLPDLGGDGAETNATWVAPVDGRCPDGYPIKGNANSGIYHVPGGRFYERTVPERCYATEADAIADGYRRAKA